MPAMTVRNVSDAVHRALRMRAAQNARSVAAEMRDILETAVKPPGRIKLGSVLAEIGKEVGLTEEEFAVFSQIRDKSPARAARFE